MTTPESFEAAAGGMCDIPQFLLWRLEWVTEECKYRKQPASPDGARWPVAGDDPANWMTYAAARAKLARLNQTATPAARFGLGFWLTTDCGYWFLDIDKCVSADGTLMPFAVGMLNAYPGAFAEWSSSRKGVHIIGRGDVHADHRNKPEREVASRLAPLELEFYSYDRGIAFGLDGVAQGSADTVFNMAPLLAQYFPPRPERESGRRPEWRGPADDDVLLERALGARVSAETAFNGKASFAQLFNGQSEKNNENDMALCAHLAFWTGCDAERMERLARRSGLQRAKWSERRRHTTYLGLTIENACKGVDTVYQERMPELPAPRPPTAGPTVRNAADLQRQKFQPIQWALQDLLPEGVTILSSDPKLGKSWMVYGWCIAIATGKAIWEGRDAERQGDALLLALEDNDRRMRRRLDKLLPTFGNPAIGRLFYACDWPRGADGVTAIRDFLIAHTETRIVVIDTIAAFRTADPGRKNAYTWDYEVGALLKPLSQEFQCAFVLVSHNRKAGAGDTHINQEVSGTTGLVGGVDNVFVLKRSSGNVTAVLHTDGRDIEQQLELALQLHDGRWGFVGNAKDVNRSQQRNSVLEALNRVGGVGTARDIHEAMGATEKLGTLRVRLTRMVSAGELDLSGRLYSRAHPDTRFTQVVTPPPMPGVTNTGVTPPLPGVTNAVTPLMASTTPLTPSTGNYTPP